MPVLYKGQVSHSLEEARIMSKKHIRALADTIPTRLKEMRIQQGNNPLSASKKYTMQYTDDPMRDIGEWFDSHLDQQYEKNQNTASQDLTNL